MEGERVQKNDAELRYKRRADILRGVRDDSSSSDDGERHRDQELNAERIPEHA